MAIGKGLLAVLGTTVVAALAVGAAIGVHTLVGETTEEAAPSASPSPTPSETASAADPFCELMAEFETLGEDGGPPFSPTSGQLDTLSPDEAEALASIRAWGQELMDLSVPQAAMEREAATIVDDPAIAEAFEAAAAGSDFLGGTLGGYARDAESVDAFSEQVMSITADPEFEAAMNAADDAIAEINTYVADECEIFLTGTDPAALSAKADVSTLGMEIATLFVDWNEGDPFPVVTVSRGSYYLDGVRIADVSKGVELVDQSGTDGSDWCVSVSYEGRADATYRYSAEGGLEDGSCGAPGGAGPQWPPSQ